MGALACCRDVNNISPSLQHCHLQYVLNIPRHQLITPKHRQSNAPYGSPYAQWRIMQERPDESYAISHPANHMASPKPYLRASNTKSLLQRRNDKQLVSNQINTLTVPLPMRPCAHMVQMVVSTSASPKEQPRNVDSKLHHRKIQLLAHCLQCFMHLRRSVPPVAHYPSAAKCDIPERACLLSVTRPSLSRRRADASRPRTSKSRTGISTPLERVFRSMFDRTVSWAHAIARHCSPLLPGSQSSRTHNACLLHVTRVRHHNWLSCCARAPPYTCWTQAQVQQVAD